MWSAATIKINLNYVTLELELQIMGLGAGQWLVRKSSLEVGKMVKCVLQW